VKGRITLLGVVGLLVAAMRGELARAQASSGTQAVRAYVGERLALFVRDPPLRAVWHLDPRSRRLEMCWSVVGSTHRLPANRTVIDFRVMPIKDEDDAHRSDSTQRRRVRSPASQGWHS
jgi:hypothetical protein